MIIISNAPKAGAARNRPKPSAPICKTSWAKIGNSAMMLIAVTGFGLCTLLFAVTRQLYFSVAVLIIMGACDSINIVIRQTILQLIPPKDMLGRVAAINGIFVTSSNELGALQSSVMTRFFSVIPAMLMGGSLSLLCVVLTKLKTKDLFNFRF